MSFGGQYHDGFFLIGKTVLFCNSFVDEFGLLFHECRGLADGACPYFAIYEVLEKQARHYDRRVADYWKHVRRGVLHIDDAKQVCNHIGKCP